MRVSQLMLVVAALAAAAVRPVGAEEAVNGAVYIVTYFDTAPAAVAEAAAAARQFEEASRKEDGNAEFEVLEEIGRPSRFAILEAWRDKKAAETHLGAAASSGFRDKLQPLLIGGLGVRYFSGLSVAERTARPPQRALYILTHVDVFPQHKDQAVELVKAQADAGRKDNGNLRFDVLQWDGHPNHFTLVEVWRDRKAFDASLVTAHTKEFRQKLTPLEGALYDERLYQPVSLSSRSREERPG
jgi:quinol monooxygenase YgiN